MTYQKPLLADFVALEQLDDASLWAIALACQSTGEITRCDRLLDRNREGVLADAERLELTTLRIQADRIHATHSPKLLYYALCGHKARLQQVIADRALPTKGSGSNNSRLLANPSRQNSTRKPHAIAFDRVSVTARDLMQLG